MGGLGYLSPPQHPGPRATPEQDKAQLVTSVSEGEHRGKDKDLCSLSLLGSGLDCPLVPESGWSHICLGGHPHLPIPALPVMPLCTELHKLHVYLDLAVRSSIGLLF